MKYFIADLHLAHPKLAELRGFSTIAEHDAVILEGLHALDPKNDQVWILGDICSGSRGSMMNALGELVLVKTPMYLVTGNHDPVNPMHRTGHKHWPEFTGVFQAIFQHGRTSIGGTRALLSHYPYQGAGDHTDEERFEQYRLPDMGEWLIHGHTHSSRLRSGPKSICVSAEATALRPISEQQIALEMERTHG